MIRYRLKRSPQARVRSETEYPQIHDKSMNSPSRTLFAPIYPSALISSPGEEFFPQDGEPGRVRDDPVQVLFQVLQSLVHQAGHAEKVRRDQDRDRPTCIFPIGARTK